MTWKKKGGCTDEKKFIKIGKGKTNSIVGIIEGVVVIASLFAPSMGSVPWSMGI